LVEEVIHENGVEVVRNSVLVDRLLNEVIHEIEDFKRTIRKIEG